MSVIAWICAELGDDVVRWAIKVSPNIPFFDSEEFAIKLNFRTQILKGAKTSMIQAQRICVMVSSYMVIPYVLGFMVIISYLTVLMQLLGAQLYPFVLFITMLFAASSVENSDSDTDSDSDSETTQQDLQDDS